MTSSTLLSPEVLIFAYQPIRVRGSIYSGEIGAGGGGVCQGLYYRYSVTMWPLLLRDRRAHWGQDHTRLWQHLSWALQVAVVGVTWSSCSARVSATLDLQLTKFHHLTPITVATMKNKNVPVMMWRSQNPHKTRVGLLNGATSMENNTAVPQRLRSRILP